MGGGVQTIGIITYSSSMFLLLFLDIFNAIIVPPFVWVIVSLQETGNEWQEDT